MRRGATAPCRLLCFGRLKYFAYLKDKFSVSLISATSLTGICLLSSLGHMTELSINAYNISDFSDVACMNNIQVLELSSFPGSSLEPVSKLSRLHDLRISLQPDTPIDLAPLIALGNLQRFSFNQSIRLGTLALPIDISALRGLKSLVSASFIGAFVPDLSPLNDSRILQDLTIGDRSIPGITALSDVPLKSLHVIHDEGVSTLSLEPIVTLKNLESLDIAAGVDVLDVSPLRNLSQLSDLTITGGAGMFSGNRQALHLESIKSIGEMHNLKHLGRVWLSSWTLTSSRANSHP